MLQQQRHHAVQTRKKRASQACQHCHNRKIRCDVNLRGKPCSNCSFCETDCIIVGRTKYRMDRIRSVTGPHGSTKPTLRPLQDVPQDSDSSDIVERARQAVAAPATPGRDERQHDRDATTLSNHHDALPAQDRFQPDSQEEGRENPVDEYLDLLNKFDHSKLDPSYNLSATRNDKANSHSGTISTVLASSKPGPHQSVTNNTLPKRTTEIPFAYYPFLQMGKQRKLVPRDIRFLESCGCFHVPSAATLDVITQQYFLYFHPYFPLLDEDKFWDMYTGRQNDDGQTSLTMSVFLFQCMLAIASPFLTEEVTRAAGFATPWQAQAVLYRRAKLLYDFGLRGDPLSNIQGALLLTFCCPVISGGDNNNTYWLSVAVQAATFAGIHDSPLQSCSRSSREDLLRKKIWQCCLLRDRFLSIAVRRPLQIPHDLCRFDKPLLAAFDFEPEFTRSLVYDVETKQQLAKSFVELCELAALTSDIVMILYPPNYSLNAFPKNPPAAKDCLTVCEGYVCKLLDWMKTKSKENAQNSSLPHDATLLYAEFIRIQHQSLVIALSHHIIFFAQSLIGFEGSHWLVSIYQSRDNIQQAVRSITASISILVTKNLVTRLPVNVLAHILVPLILHSVNARLAPDELRKNYAQGELDPCMDTLKLLTYLHDHSGYIVRIAATCLEGFNRRVCSRAKNVAEPGWNRWPADPTLQPSDWIDLLIHMPMKYLYLIAFLDLSLSRGCLPSEDEVARHLCTLLPSQTDEEVEFQLICDTDTNAGPAGVQTNTHRISNQFENFDLPPDVWSLDFDGVMNGDFDDNSWLAGCLER